MAYKILGQVQPTTTDNVDLYAVPAGSATIISTLHLSNTAATSSRVTVYVRKFDGTLAVAALANNLFSKVLVSPGEPVSLTVGITLAENDTITVATESSNTVTFHAFGSENEV